MTLSAPFPWFGGKARAAHLVWAALGNVGAYCEPFAGGLACLLARPAVHGVETVNDINGYLVNFWRAVQAAPQEVARFAEWPPFELDLEARHKWLVTTGAERVARLRSEPDYFDAQVAGWWAWGIDLWIGAGWCAGGGAQVPRPKVPRSDPRRGASGSVGAVYARLSARLRTVRVLCGDWTSAVSPSSLTATLRATGGGRHGTTGVLLDPPYLTGEDLYGDVTGVCHDVYRWAEEHGDDPHLRIVVCGHEGDWSPPTGWQTVPWSGRRAFASTKGSGALERLWCSPACLLVVTRPQLSLGIGAEVGR